MTRTMYGAAVTAIIDERTGGTFDYPESFETDVDACLAGRMSPEDAAAKLMRDYGVTD